MKQTVLILSLLFLVFSCGDTEITDENYTDLIGMEELPEVKFEETEYNFGTIIEGKVIEYRFHFTNTGKGPLVISAVEGSCGCTAIKNWPRTPIKPGEKAHIDAVFESEGFPGDAEKVFTMVANTFPTNTYLKFKGTVVGPEN